MVPTRPVSGSLSRRAGGIAASAADRPRSFASSGRSRSVPPALRCCWCTGRAGPRAGRPSASGLESPRPDPQGLSERRAYARGRGRARRTALNIRLRSSEGPGLTRHPEPQGLSARARRCGSWRERQRRPERGQRRRWWQRSARPSGPQGPACLRRPPSEAPATSRPAPSGPTSGRLHPRDGPPRERR